MNTPVGHRSSTLLGPESNGGSGALLRGTTAHGPFRSVSLELINYYLHLKETITSSETEIKNMFVQVKKYERTPLVLQPYSTRNIQYTLHDDDTTTRLHLLRRWNTGEGILMWAPSSRPDIKVLC